MLISQNPWLYNSSLLMGAIPTLIGVQLLANPDAGFGILGFKRPTGAEDRKLAESLFMFIGARDLVLGLSTIAAWQIKSRTMLGLILVSGGGMCVLDGIINRRQVGEGEWKHWGYVPFITGIGGGLLGWFD